LQRRSAADAVFCPSIFNIPGSASCRKAISLLAGPPGRQKTGLFSQSERDTLAGAYADVTEYFFPAEAVQNTDYKIPFAAPCTAAGQDYICNRKELFELTANSFSTSLTTIV
jgi:hypothetical protein